MSTLEELDAVLEYAERNGYYSVRSKFGAKMSMQLHDIIRGKVTFGGEISSDVIEKIKGFRQKETKIVRKPRTLTDANVCEILKMRINGDLIREIHMNFTMISRGYIEFICSGKKRISTDEQKKLFEALSKLDVDGRFSRNRHIVKNKKSRDKSNISAIELKDRYSEGIKSSFYPTPR